MRLRRSELSTPGNNPHKIAKAAGSSADLVLLDLEDSVPPDEKANARTNVIRALHTLNWEYKTCAVRINSLETEYAYQDIITLVEEAGTKLGLLIIPKIRTARELWWVDLLLTQIEKRMKLTRRIQLEVFIEEVEAMINVEKIARASTRVEALIFGPADYSASQGISGDGSETSYPGDIWHYARNKIVIAARAAGIDAIDGAYANFKDGAGYKQECERAKTLGFVGKWAIHPSQIEIANEVFSPGDAEVAYARKVDQAYTAALHNGQGAIAIDGKMIDAAIMRSLKALLQRAEAIQQQSEHHQLG